MGSIKDAEKPETKHPPPAHQLNKSHPEGWGRWAWQRAREPLRKRAEQHNQSSHAGSHLKA